MKIKQEVMVNIHVTGVDKAIKKARRLKRLLKKANSLANELATGDLSITICM